MALRIGGGGGDTPTEDLWVLVREMFIHDDIAWMWCGNPYPKIYHHVTSKRNSHMLQLYNSTFSRAFQASEGYKHSCNN